MAASAAVRPIIVIKKKVSHGGHHGGAWKVAYADFVTAMMSLFIVLWLLNSTPQVKKAIAGYFNDPRSAGKDTGSANLGAGETVSIDQKNVEKLKEEIEKAILKQEDLDKLSKQIEITITTEGLKIELIEDKGGTFFESGSAKLSVAGVKLLTMLAGQMNTLPNHLLIEGHTDSQPYSSDNGYTNWELSSDRANAARRVLQQGGVGAGQIAQVRGYADQFLRVPGNPMDPSNRRISLIVQWVKAPAAAPGAEEAGKETKETPDNASEEAKRATGEAKGTTGDAKPVSEAGGKTIAPDAGAVAVPSKAALAAKPAAGVPKLGMTDRVKSLMPGRKK